MPAIETLRTLNNCDRLTCQVSVFFFEFARQKINKNKREKKVKPSSHTRRTECESAKNVSPHVATILRATRPTLLKLLSRRTVRGRLFDFRFHKKTILNKGILKYFFSSNLMFENLKKYKNYS